MTRPVSPPRVLILGAGLSGLVLANLVDPGVATVTVLEQDFPPGRPGQFHGIVRRADLESIGLQAIGMPHQVVETVVPIELGHGVQRATRNVEGWVVIEHRALLNALRTRAVAKGARILANQGEVDLVWRDGAIGGLRLVDAGDQVDADIVVFADESDPRLVERLGLRPDWLPTQLMHLAKQRYEVREEGVPRTSVLAFAGAASWGSPGHGLLIPGRDAVTLKVAMLLEDEMATARHIREYLAEVVQAPPLRDRLRGLEEGTFVTEVVPVGGYDTRPRFHGDGALVVNDLLGLTHPLNRDGISTTIDVALAAAAAIREAGRAGEYAAQRLAVYSGRLGREVIAPVSSRRRAGQVPPWQRASLPELAVTHAGVTATPNSAKLPARRGIVRRMSRLVRR